MVLPPGISPISSILMTISWLYWGGRMVGSVVLTRLTKFHFGAKAGTCACRSPQLPRPQILAGGRSLKRFANSFEIRTNSLVVVIPCHRAIKNDGAFSGYRWGVERKKALITREAR